VKAVVSGTIGTSRQSQAQALVPFFIIWTGQAFSLLGSELVQFALVWYLTTSTGSATVLTSASLVAMLPKVFLGPVVGALVDRWNRRVVMIVADSLIALATAGLATLFALHVVQVWHIYVLMFVRPLGGAFHSPAMAASTTLMVPGKHLSRIQGMNEALFGAMSILAPALGALLLDLLPMHSILAIDVVTALPAILSLCFVFIPQPEVAAVGEGTPERTGSKPSVLEDLCEGLRFVRGRPGLLTIASIHALIYLLMVPAYSLLPILVTEHLRGDAPQLAWLQAAEAGGIIAGGLILSVWGGFGRRVVTMSLATALSGVGWVALGGAPANGFVMAVGAALFSAAMNAIMVGSVRALYQAIVPPEMQGRVFALSLAIVTGVTPIGLAVAGPVSDTVGVRPWFVIGGLATAVLGVGSFFVPVLMRIEDEAA
jgi:DHA3 family macrolide efflux protein-like MFS transporter